LPFLFAIPDSVDASSVAQANPSYAWRIRVEADDAAGRVDLAFPVPVFRTADSRSDYRLPEGGLEPLIKQETPADVLRRSGFPLRREGDSLTVDFPAFRNASMVAIWFPVGLVMAAVPIGMMVAFVRGVSMRDDPDGAAGIVLGVVTLLFGLVVGAISLLFALLGLLLAGSVVADWFASSRIEIEGREVRWVRSCFGRRTIRETDFDNVQQIRTRKTASAGLDQLFNVLVELKDGPTFKGRPRPTPIATGLSKEAATALAALLEERMTGA
jgi:uncharacterized protein (DUF697 family)